MEDFSPRARRDGAVHLTTLFQLKPKLRMNGSIHLLPHTPAWHRQDSFNFLLLSLTRTVSLFVFRHERERGILFWGCFQEASPYRWTEVIEIASISWLNGTRCLAFLPLSPEDEYRSSFITVAWKRCKMAGNVWSTSHAWKFHVWRSVASSCRGLTLCRLSHVPLADMPGRDFLACHIFFVRYGAWLAASRAIYQPSAHLYIAVTPNILGPCCPWNLCPYFIPQFSKHLTA